MKKVSKIIIAISSIYLFLHITLSISNKDFLNIKALDMNFGNTYSGGSSSFFVDSNDTLWAWGFNYHGSLGIGNTNNQSEPVKVMDDIRFVSSSGSYTLALKNDDSLWAWGSNYYGTLGDGTNVNRILPIKIMEGVKFVSAGETHSLAIKNDGSLWAWGSNEKGELGDGTTVGQLMPIKIMDSVKNVTAGNHFSLVIKEDNSLWAWGVNNYGQLGDGTKVDSLFPVNILEDVRLVEAGNDNSFAIKNDGSLWAWGANYNAQLGDGTRVDKLLPTKIIDGVRNIYLGYVHTLALMEDESLWGWGSNSVNQLGNGTNTDSDIPIIILENVKDASVGYDHNFAVKSDGSLWAWGWNYHTQLGDGTSNNSELPIRIDKYPELIYGVENGKYYNSNRTIVFESGKVLLNGEVIESLTELTEEGEYTVTSFGSFGRYDTYVFSIDFTPPQIIINEYIKEFTNEDITVFAYSDGTLNTTSHTFIENGSYEFISIDFAGNQSKLIVTVTNIDKVLPIVTGVMNNASYNQSVFIEYNEGFATLNGVEFLSGTSIDEEGIYDLQVIDLAGNIQNVHFTVDKTAPIIQIDDYIKSMTNEDIIVHASVNEGFLNVNSYTFDKNGSFEFVATDLAGNISSTKINIDNIDKVVPIISFEPYVLDITNKDIIVYAKTNEGSLNVDSHTFIENGSFDFIATDEAGNRTIETIKITNIDKVAPIVSGVENGKIYNTIVTIYFNEGIALLNSKPITSGEVIYGLGNQTLIVTDNAGNIRTIKFTMNSAAKLNAILLNYNSSQLIWNKVEGASGYEIHFSRGNSLTYTLLKTQTNVTPVIQTGLTANTVYNYKVRAYRLSGTIKTYGAFSDVKSIMTPPSSPVLKVVSKNSDTLSLSWDAVPGTTQYELYKNSVLIDTLESTVLSKDISGLDLGSSYKFSIIALNGELRSNPSIAVSGIPVPAAPADLRIVSKNYNGFNLSWNSVENNTLYEVWRSTSSTGTYSLVGTTQETQFIDTKASFNVTYYYKVRSTIDLIKGSFSNVISGKTTLITPSGINVTLGTNSSANLSWLAVDGAQGYEISYSKGTSTTYTVLRSVTSLSTSHTGLTLNTKYNYRVRAYRLVGTTRIYSAYSELRSITTPPVAPSIKVISKDANTLVLSWNSVLNATAYEIYQDNVLIDTVGNNTLTKDVTNLQLGISYQYKVVAVNGELRSNPSVSVSGTPIPAAPSNLSITNPNYNGFIIQWDSVIESTSYEVWRSTSLTGTYTLLSTINQTEYLDNKANFNTTYFYKVRAIVNSIKGTFTNTISGKTTLLIPQNLQVNLLTPSSVNIDWDAVDGAQGYEISYVKGTSTTYTVLRTVTSLSTSHTGLSLNSTYTYRVRAYRLVGTTRIYSAFFALQRITTPPVAPTIKVVSKDANTLVLSWNSVLNATAYEIYQDNVLIDTVDKNTLTKEVSNLQLGTTYQYRLIALNGELRSSFSTSVISSPIPAAPTNLSISKPNYNGFTIKWDSVIDSTNYEVWRSTSLTGTYTLLSTINQTEYLDNKANFNTTYYYKVRAIVSNIKGSYSNIINHKTSLQSPITIDLVATNASSSRITWTAVDGAQGYEVFYAKGTSTSFTLLRSVTSLTTNHTGLTLNSKYTYRVRAYRLLGTTRIYSAYSENFVIDYNSTFVLPHLAGILGTSTGVEDSKLKITNYLNVRKVGNIKFVIGDYNVGIGQVFNQTPDAMTTPHIYDLITIYISNS